MVRFLVVEPAHQGSSPRLDNGARIFLNLSQNLTGAILLVVGDVSVDSEALVVISSISRICRLSLSEVIIGVGLRACIHRVSVRAFVSVCVLKKKKKFVR